MTKEEIKELEFGVYILFWKDGGYSTASVGGLSNGDKWFAPTNWTSEKKENVVSTDWEPVLSVQLIASRRHLYAQMEEAEKWIKSIETSSQKFYPQFIFNHIVITKSK